MLKLPRGARGVALATGAIGVLAGTIVGGAVLWEGADAAWTVAVVAAAVVGATSRGPAQALGLVVILSVPAVVIGALNAGSETETESLLLLDLIPLAALVLATLAGLLVGMTLQRLTR